MVDVDLVQAFALALALGALIGLEREHALAKKRAWGYAGIRTFPLIALFGALCAYLGDSINIYLMVVGMILIGILSIVEHFMITREVHKYVGATTEIAAFLTFFIGALSYYHEYTLAVAMAIIITIILFSRSFLHRFAKRIKEKELSDTLKFAVIAFVILPFLPNKGYGPLEIFNPYVIWLMVVFISGIGFAGYVLMKWMGEKGIALAGILGGLVSSTAVTTSFAQRSRKEPKIYKALVLGVILANGLMFARILLEVFVLNRSLFLKVLLPLLVLATITLIFSYIFYKHAKSVKGKISLSSPFTLGPALKFGLFFALILALVKVADAYMSSKGVYLISFISGFADVDAITVSLSQLARTSLSEEVAKRGIILAALTNVAVKGGIAYFLGGKRFGRIILLFYILLIIAGIIFLFI